MRVYKRDRRSQVLHHDIAPGNLLLNSTRQLLKIADFGLADYYVEDKSISQNVGQRGYAAPEMLDNVGGHVVCRAYPFACDVYSWAQCLKHTLAGCDSVTWHSNLLPLELSVLRIVDVVYDTFAKFLAAASSARASERPDIDECVVTLELWQQHFPGKIRRETSASIIVLTESCAYIHEQRPQESNWAMTAATLSAAQHSERLDSETSLRYFDQIATTSTVESISASAGYYPMHF